MSTNVRIINHEIQEKPKIQILCIDISHFNQNRQFFVCSLAVFVFFILYGYMQELLFTLEGFKPFGWYLTLVQFAYYTIFGIIEKCLKQVTTRRIPMPTYFLLALLTLGTMGLSNSSLGYLNYPTQVIFKCCKLIPVLIGSILIQGKRYGPIDFSAAILMCIGLTMFTLADSHISPNFNTKGVMMISLALFCDAIIGNVQEKAMKTYNAPNSEVVLYSYAIGFAYVFLAMLFTGDLYEGVKFCAQYPTKTYGYALIFSLTGYLGIQIVLTLVRTCGAFVAVTVTTFQYLWSGLLVILGIYLNMYSKKHPFTFHDFELKLKYFIQYFKNKPYTRVKGHLMTNV